MTNQFNEALQAVAQMHQNDLEQDAKDNPPYRPGMFVTVWGKEITATEREYLGRGKVLTVEWDDHHMRHFHDVYMMEENQIWENVYDSYMTRFVPTIEESRRAKKLAVIVGGMA